jgi:hypothetical protein
MKRSIQSLLRLPVGGWRRSFMKSIVGPGPAKNASQDWSAGAIIRLRPTLVTSTWRTVFGSASALGMRTACVRFVVKTVERAILTPGRRGISRKDIRRPSHSVKANVTFSKTNPSQNDDTHAGARRYRFRREKREFGATFTGTSRSLSSRASPRGSRRSQAWSPPRPTAGTLPRSVPIMSSRSWPCLSPVYAVNAPPAARFTPN